MFISYIRYLVESASNHSFILFLTVGLIVLGALALILSFTVPQHQAFVVERFGKYQRTLEAGFHVLIPFVDRIAYRHSLKEFTMNVFPQLCITKDNVAVRIDGLVSMSVCDPQRASYGNENYRTAVRQLAQTAVQSEVGRLDFDETLKNQDQMNARIFLGLQKASEAWGVKVNRYETANFEPTQLATGILEKRFRVKRKTRAQVPLSERRGSATAALMKGEESVRQPEEKKVSRGHDAQERAREIMLLANAAAEGIARIAREIEKPGGREAVNFQVVAQNTIELAKLKKSASVAMDADYRGADGSVSSAKSRKVRKHGQKPAEFSGRGLAQVM